jgi:hypothetical protein
MVKGGMAAMQRVTKKFSRRIRCEIFKLLTINSVKTRELRLDMSYNRGMIASPIKQPDYMSLMEECQVMGHNNSLLVEQFDENSKMSTFSKI